MHMYVYADCGSLDVSGITLVDGCLPTICGRQRHHPKKGTAADGSFIEPIHWFKVLVVDIVCVDCSRRQLSWETTNLDDGTENELEYSLLDTGRKRGTLNPDQMTDLPMSMCATDSLDLDELFDSLPGLVKDYQDSVITKTQFHDNVMKLLHLYILPTISLSSVHVVRMRECMLKQDDCLGRTNDDIERTSIKLEAVSLSKKKLRNKFISEVIVNDELFVPQSICDSLVKDIDRDVLDIAEELEVAQSQVDRIKRSLSSGSDVADDAVAELEVMRSNRDGVMRLYETLLRAREYVRRAPANSSRSPKSHRARSPKGQRVTQFDKPELDIYDALTGLQEEIVSSMKFLTEKKLMILSVKESMKLTLVELETGVDTCGVDVECYGFMSSVVDALDSSSKPKSWMTLNEQVANVLDNPTHPVTQMHNMFCNSIITRCKAAVTERDLYDLTFGENPNNEIPVNSDPFSNCSQSKVGKSDLPCLTSPLIGSYGTPTNGRSVSQPVPPTSSNGGHQKKGGRKSRQKQKAAFYTNSIYSEDGIESHKKSTLRMQNSTYDDAVLIFDQDSNYTKRAISSLQQDIERHFDTVTEQLRLELKQKSKTSIWLSYDSHFYGETINHILSLYELEYSGVTKVLVKAIPSLKVTDLSFEDSILANMLKEQEKELINPSSTNNETLPKKSAKDRKSSKRKKNGNKDNSECSETTPGSDTAFARLSLAAKPEVPVEDFLPRLKMVSENGLKNTDHVQCLDSFESSTGLQEKESESTSNNMTCTIRRSIKVAHPFTTVIFYDRTLDCPNSGTKTDTSHKSAARSNAVEDIQKIRRTRTMVIKPEHRCNFQHAFDCISIAVSSKCMSTKFQQLAKCLRETSRQISIFCQQLKGLTNGVATCCDELMDGLIMLLCNMDGPLLSQLYVQVMMLIDLMPPFFKSNSFNFTLVQFVVAFQFLIDQIVLKKKI